MRYQKNARVVILLLAVGVLTALHFTLRTQPHPWHVIHVVMGALYLLPIITAAIWFGIRGGLAASLAIALVYLTHIRWSWAGQPMENANQLAMTAVYILMGSVAGVLVHLQNRERARRQETERRAEREAVLQGFASLCGALGARDEYSLRHSEHVSRLAVEIGRRKGLRGEGLEVLRLAALVHDIGKLGVRDDILLKPGRLSPEERASIERHTVLAADILRPIQGAREIATIVEAHHECPDGSGYPYGLKGSEIPLQARILSVADVFSALIAPRPYKPAMELNQVMENMGRMAAHAKLDVECVLTLQEIIWDRSWMDESLFTPETANSAAPSGAFGEPKSAIVPSSRLAAS